MQKYPIWGEGNACASDGKRFLAWDQNLMTEWRTRYKGYGVKIYWHVETNAVSIYSQLKNHSASEAAAMIEGLIRHDTQMRVEKNFVDSHGQSEIALYLFESNRLRPYSTRRIRQIIKQYANKANIKKRVYPHLFRHQLITFLTRQGIISPKIQLLSGHAEEKNLAIYRDLALKDVAEEYEQAMKSFPIK